MSHHLDSPIARQDVRLDITDLYVFRGEVGTVFAINVCHSIAGDIPEPGYHPEGKYEFKMDLDGDAVEDITYRFVFDERDSDGRQQFELRRIDGADAANPFAEGVVVAEGGPDAEVIGTGGLRVWTGRAGDPFWIEPTVLHAVGHAFHDGTTIDLGSWTPDQATNLFAGHNAYTIVLELPDEAIAGAGGGSDPAAIGVWAVASLATDAGGWRSINRIGLPMIHPLFAQFDEEIGNDLNAGRPSDDFARYGAKLGSEIASVVRAYGTSVDPDGHGRAVAHRFFPNVLPYVVGTHAEFGFNGWNGRSLIDNAPNVMFSLAANTPVNLGIGRESIASKPRPAFPYVPAAN